MAKKKIGKVIQMLSPENYIRKKSRSLPIYECLVNTNWQKDGIAHVIVARSHTNGNITVCFYLIDLYCLGVKDTQYLFNISETKYQEKKEGMEHVDFEPIDYPLAHNIVFAGLEFAEEYGFKPHKDFTSITQFMLEEDSENIEMIDIECGKDGKPFFVSGPYDDQVKINQVMAQLERNAGPGKYDFLIEDNPDSEEDGFNILSYEQKRDLFHDLYSRRDELEDEEFEQLNNLTNHIFDNVTDTELVDQFSEEFLDDFDFELTQDIVTEEMLGLPDQNIDSDTRELFLGIYSKASSNSVKARRLLKKFNSETPENPASCFLELIILREENSADYSEKLKEYFSRFPEFPLLRILMTIDNFFNDEIEVDLIMENFTMQSVFAGRTLIHSMEVFNYLSVLFMGLFRLGDFDRFEGLCQAYLNLELSDLEFELSDHLVFVIKTNLVNSLFEMA
ncbi:MAG: hypothetical protein Q8S54_07650 [Bacteroidota bacterium]|nr:hypothetical protein [Bacteroidota bacterium]